MSDRNARRAACDVPLAALRLALLALTAEDIDDAPRGEALLLVHDLTECLRIAFADIDARRS